MAININIASEYTKTPGGRLASEGDHSGEDFRNSILKPKFIESLRSGDELVVNLDGGYGYATSFLEEAFGGLARDVKDARILKIKIVSDEEPALIEKIYLYMNEALKK